MFHSARWKAYLKDIMDKEPENDGAPTVIYHIYHSQEIWFAQEGKKPDHQDAAKENLKRSDVLLKDCADRVDALEETLANTPKPSEMLNWDSLTLQDLA
ncbi:MAG: hypothetical protein A2Y92_03190 [Chloroflexi bacterium RBG_13_57_8]|nr:MAG: hypothetical protein A2Y92_03190 [Chloroflexi bacterium RBG_13_57_8]